MGFVANDNKEFTNKGYVNVLDQSTHEILAFPETMSSDDISQAISDDKNGTISQAKPNWYNDKIRPVLEKSGLDMFQPKFLMTKVDTDATRAFTTAYAKEGSFGLLENKNSHIIQLNKEAQSLHPIATFSGNLVGQTQSILMTAGLSEILGFGKMVGAVADKAGKMAGNVISGAAIGSLYGGITKSIDEINNSIKEDTHPDLVRIGSQVLKDAGIFGLYGVPGSLASIPVASTAIAGMAYTISKLEGADEKDALLNAAVMGISHAVNTGSQTSEQLNQHQNTLDKVKADYIKSKNPIIHDAIVDRTAQEHMMVIQDEIIPGVPKSNIDIEKAIDLFTRGKMTENQLDFIIKQKLTPTKEIINKQIEDILDIKSEIIPSNSEGNIGDRQLMDQAIKDFSEGKITEDEFSQIANKGLTIKENLSLQELDKERKDKISSMGKLSSEIGQVNIPGVDEIAAITKEAINVISPRSFVPKKALDEVMKMKGGQDKAEFELETRLDNITKKMDKWHKFRQIEFVDNIKLDKKQATPALDNLSKMMRDIEDNYWKEAKQYKASLAYKENHYRVLWKIIPGQESKGKGFKGLFRRPLQGTKGFSKQSTLDSMSEGIALGGEPYSYNPMVMWKNSIIDMQKFITAQRMFKSMKDMGYAKFVKTGGKAPDDFVQLNDNIAKVYFPTEQGLIKTGEYYIQEDVGRILNNYLSKDLVRSSELGSSLMALKNITTSIELSLSPFHAAYVSLSTGSSSIGLGFQKMINRGIIQQDPQAFLDGLKDVMTFGSSPISYTKAGSKAIKMMSKDDFINTPEGQDFIKEYPEAKRLLEDLFIGGGKLAIHQDYKINSVRAFKDGIKNKEPWAVAFSSIPAANEIIMKPLFEMYIPRLKIGTFLKEYSNELVQRKDQLTNGKLTRPELARKVWDSVENRLGEMNFDNLFWDRTFKSAMQLMFRSVTWKIGALKNIGQALPEQISEVVNAAKENRAPLLTQNIAWLVGVSALVAGFSYITMGMLGQGHPKDLKDIISPKYDKDGNRISLNTHVKDWVHIWHSPLGFITNSLSGEIGKIIDLWNNKDFYGVEIYHPDDPLYKQAFDAIKFLIPVPFSISNQTKLKGDQAPEVLKVTTLLGITQPSPGYISNTAAMEEAHNIMHSKEEIGARTKEEFEKQKFRTELRKDYIRTGDRTKLDQAVKDGKITIRQESNIIKNSSKTSLENIASRNDVSYNEVAKMIKVANESEISQLIPIFDRKIKNKIDNSPMIDKEELIKYRKDILSKYGFKK